MARLFVKGQKKGQKDTEGDIKRDTEHNVLLHSVTELHLIMVVLIL